MAYLVLSTTSVDQLDGAQFVGVGYLARVMRLLLFLDALFRVHRSVGDDRMWLGLSVWDVIDVVDVDSSGNRRLCEWG